MQRKYEDKDKRRLLALDDYTKDAVRVLESESRRLAEEAGVLTTGTERITNSQRRRRILRELQRRHPDVTVKVGLENGKEVWRVSGDGGLEAGVMESLRDLLRPDGILMTQDPFEVPHEEACELERRIRERGAGLEID